MEANPVLLIAGVFAFTVFLRLCETSFQVKKILPVLRAYQFWLYAVFSAAITATAAWLLIQTSGWRAAVVFAVACFAGVSVLRSFVVRFGDADVNLAKMLEAWREQVETDIAERVALTEARENARPARELADVYSDSPEVLEDAASNLADSMGISPSEDEELAEILDSSDQPGLVATARWIVTTDPQYAERLESQAGD